MVGGVMEGEAQIGVLGLSMAMNLRIEMPYLICASYSITTPTITYPSTPSQGKSKMSYLSIDATRLRSNAEADFSNGQSPL